MIHDFSTNTYQLAGELVGQKVFDFYRSSFVQDGETKQEKQRFDLLTNRGTYIFTFLPKPLTEKEDIFVCDYQGDIKNKTIIGIDIFCRELDLGSHARVIANLKKEVGVWYYSPNKLWSVKFSLREDDKDSEFHIYHLNGHNGYYDSYVQISKLQSFSKSVNLFI